MSNKNYAYRKKPAPQETKKQRCVRLIRAAPRLKRELSESSGKKKTKYNLDKTRGMQRLGETFGDVPKNVQKDVTFSFSSHIKCPRYRKH